MKTARFLFTIAGFGALTLGLGYAAEPSRQPSEQDVHQIHATGDHPAGPVHGKQTPSKTDPASRKLSQPKAEGRASTKRRQAGPIRLQPKSAPANALPPPALKTAAPAPKAGSGMGGSMVNKAGNQPLAKLPGVGGTTAPSPGAVRGRSATAAVLGGLAASGAKNSAAVINGTAMKSKP